jgi:protein dithiol oxidoreductase (disulfide-forming)
MKNALAGLALILLGLAACGGGGPENTAAPSAPEPPTAAAPPSAAAKDASPAALNRAATANQESTADAGADRGDVRLEKLAAMPASAQLPAGRWKAGTNYLPLSPAQPTGVEPGQVEVIEVFWYGCPHCYALDPAIEAWKKTKPAYVRFVRVPVTWGPVHRAHARLYYTLEALGKLDALHTTTFDEIHKLGNNLAGSTDEQTLKMQSDFARAHGISEADFNKAYSSFGVNANMQHAEDVTRRYRIEGVPTFIVNGKYETDVSMAGGNAQLFELIDDLAAAEKRR